MLKVGIQLAAMYLAVENAGLTATLLKTKYKNSLRLNKGRRVWVPSATDEIARGFKAVKQNVLSDIDRQALDSAYADALAVLNATKTVGSSLTTTALAMGGLMLRNDSRGSAPVRRGVCEADFPDHIKLSFEGSDGWDVVTAKIVKGDRSAGRAVLVEDAKFSDMRTGDTVEFESVTVIKRKVRVKNTLSTLKTVLASDLITCMTTGKFSKR